MPAPVAPIPLPPERLGEAAAVMGRAVVDDPLFVSLLPDARQRASGVPPMMEMFLRIALAHGEVWVTPPPIRGVACWLSPAHSTVTAEERDAAGWSGDTTPDQGRRLLALSRAFHGDRGGARRGWVERGRGRVGPRGSGPIPGVRHRQG
jgi:hypothetical protein